MVKVNQHGNCTLSSRHGESVVVLASLLMVRQWPKILRVSLQQAWRDGKMEENPGKKVQSLKKTREGSQRRAFTIAELKSLLNEASGEWKGQILFGIYTGKRLGDVVQLRWDDLDLENKTLSMSTQKTDRRQILPLAPAVVRWLLDWSPWQLLFVIASAQGNTLHDARPSRAGQSQAEQQDDGE